MIGFIGLGIMGNAMVENLLKAGYELTIYNRSKKKADSLLAKGANWANSPKEVAEKTEVVFTMLSNPEAVFSVVTGDNGLLTGLNSGKLWVDCSTVSPAFSREMAYEAKKRQIRFVDAPVLGSKIPASNGELVFVVGGEKQDVKEISPMLEKMGKATLYQGDHGMGSSMKLVENSMLGQTMVAFAESVNFGQAMGLDKATIVNTLLNSVTTAPFLHGKKEKVLTGDFSGTEFPLQHMHKDLHLAAQTAYEKEVTLPFINLAKEFYSYAKQNGGENKDFAAVFEWIEENSK